jgi:hypothetical protein
MVVFSLQIIESHIPGMTVQINYLYDRHCLLYFINPEKDPLRVLHSLDGESEVERTYVWNLWWLHIILANLTCWGSPSWHLENNFCFLVLGLELRAYTLSHSTSHFVCVCVCGVFFFFEIGYWHPSTTKTKTKLFSKCKKGDPQS